MDLPIKGSVLAQECTLTEWYPMFIRKFGYLQDGVYLMYSQDDELLYIGKSTHLRHRVANHLRGNTNTKWFHKEVHRVAIVAAEDIPRFKAAHPNCLDFEYYLINELKPKYNKTANTISAYRNYKVTRPKTKDEMLERFALRGRAMAEKAADLGFADVVMAIRAGHGDDLSEAWDRAVPFID